jgi:hypothetical protein
VAWTARPLLLLPALVIFVAPTGAHAEGERALSVGLGWATFSTPGKKEGNMEPPQVSPDVGGALAVTYEHAIGSDFSLRAEGAFGMFYGGQDKDQTAMSRAWLGDAGATFRFDVLKYVPYAFGGVGVVQTSGGPILPGTNFVIAVGGGVDMLVSRKRSYGLEGRLASFGGDVTIFTFGLRGTARWGYF